MLKKIATDHRPAQAPAEDPHNLQRFVAAQQDVYETALAELRRGRKESHWMWFIFPQFDGLGHSSTAKFYAIKTRAEAAQYLAHPLLGPRLCECIDALLKLQDRTAHQIFGSPDDLKLNSSTTLFALVAPDPAPFEAVLTKYFHRQKDTRTIELLAEPETR